MGKSKEFKDEKPASKEPTVLVMYNGRGEMTIFANLATSFKLKIGPNFVPASIWEKARTRTNIVQCLKRGTMLEKGLAEAPQGK